MAEISIKSLAQLHSLPVTVAVSWLPDLERKLASMGVLDAELLASANPERVQKLLQFWSYDLIARTKDCGELKQRIFLLNNFFFRELGFRFLHKNALLVGPIEEQVLSHVATARAGEPLLVGLIYCYLAEQIGLRAGWVSTDKPAIIKVLLAGESVFVNLDKQSNELQAQQIVDFAQDLVGDAIEFGLIDARAYCESYFRLVLGRLLRLGQKAKSLEFLNFLNALEPSNLFVLKRRALLLLDLGETERAREDLKSYRLYTAGVALPIELQDLSERVEAALTSPEQSDFH